MCRRTQMFGIILFSMGVAFILAGLFNFAALRIILGIAGLAAGLILLK